MSEPINAELVAATVKTAVKLAADYAKDDNALFRRSRLAYDAIVTGKQSARAIATATSRERARLAHPDATAAHVDVLAETKGTAGFNVSHMTINRLSNSWAIVKDVAGLEPTVSTVALAMRAISRDKVTVIRDAVKAIADKVTAGDKRENAVCEYLFSVTVAAIADRAEKADSTDSADAGETAPADSAELPPASLETLVQAVAELSARIAAGERLTDSQIETVRSLADVLEDSLQAA